jgi:hypothetical protein
MKTYPIELKRVHKEDDFDNYVYHAWMLCYKLFGDVADKTKDPFWQLKTEDGLTYWQNITKKGELIVSDSCFSLCLRYNQELTGVLYKEIEWRVPKIEKIGSIDIEDTFNYDYEEEMRAYFYLNNKMLSSVGVTTLNVEEIKRQEVAMLSKRYSVPESAVLCYVYD